MDNLFQLKPESWHYIGSRSVKYRSMAQRILEKKTIIIPNAHHYYSQHRGKVEFEQSRHNQYKLYISPNRETKPLALVHSKGYNQTRKDKLSQPTFDNFDLSSMFSNKKLSPEEIHIFKIQNHTPHDYFETPQRKPNHHHHYKSTLKIDNTSFPLPPTENTLKNSTETKKSRPKSKGLRKLSQRAYEIVLNFRSVSYKQVANKLIDQLNNEKQLDQLGKDQQNIKRRVYDALNVLIALGVLRKEGRRIVGDRLLKLQYENRDNNALKRQIELKARSINQKRQELSDLKRKYQTLKLIQNRNINQKSNGDAKNVDMPFFILKNKAEESIVSQSQLSSKACQRLVVKWLKSQDDYMNVDIEVLSQNFKIEKQKYKMKVEENK